MLRPKGGLPLIKSTANLGWQPEWRTVICTYPVGIQPGRLEEELKQDIIKAAEWQNKDDGARFLGRVKRWPPQAHVEFRGPDTQYGDDGVHRKVARQAIRDTDPEKFDIKLEMLFAVRESIQEISTELAQQLFADPRRKSDIRPLRDNDWHKEGPTTWSLK